MIMAKFARFDPRNKKQTKSTRSAEKDKKRHHNHEEAYIENALLSKHITEYYNDRNRYR